MSTLLSNKTDLILLCIAVVVGIITIICGFSLRQYAITDFFDYGTSVDMITYSAIGFVILSIWAFGLDLPPSRSRRTITVVWTIITIATMLTSFEPTNPLTLGLDLVILLLTPASLVCVALFGASMARGYSAKRRAQKS